MPAHSLCTLPDELLSSIGQETATEALPSLLLTSKSINDVLTPLLYASIALYDYETAQMCTNTLATDPQEHYAKRDLAAYVRSFAVQFNYYGLDKELRARFARSLADALSRMCGLQQIVFESVYFGTPKVFMALVRGASRTLRSLSFKTDRPDWWPDGSDANAFDGFRPAFPALTAVKLTLTDGLPRAWYAFFRDVLASRGAHLRTLEIGDENAPSVGPLFPGPDAWSALEELVLTIGTTPDALAGFPPGLNVRKLTLGTTLGIPESPPDEDIIVLDPIPAYLFPNLEYLVCAYQLLPAFLPADAPRQRPLRTVRLNKAYYDPNGDAADSFTHSRRAPEWSNVRKVLGCLSRSAGPVVDLAFYIDWFDAKTFPGELVEYIHSVERLVIVLQQEPGNAAHISNYGKLFVAHTPRLQAFFLSDAPIKALMGSECSFLFTLVWDRQKSWLQEWENHTTALKEVAFSTECSWKKTDGSWISQVYKRDDESDEGNEESNDNAGDEDSCGDEDSVEDDGDEGTHEDVDYEDGENASGQDENDSKGIDENSDSS
ncbi:hypothetical protein GY45DRAFT_174850 [Cubamyces sp. BRFM 1775]|nr:hypothetical protein GY45DRAFT_174850 [Cubamyces sp. BRFM 1775]